MQWWMHQHQLLTHNIATLQQQRIVQVENNAQSLKQQVEEKETKIAKLEDTIVHLKKTPLGARERKRSFSSRDSCSERWCSKEKGYINKVHFLITLRISYKYDVTSVVILCFLVRNFIQETCGSQSQEDRVHLLSTCLKKIDVIALLRVPRGKHINAAVN